MAAEQPPSAPVRLLRAGGRLAANILLGVISLAIGVLLAEWGARWFYRDVTSTADFRGYFTNKWLATEVRHNHYDFRGGEFEEIKAPGAYRVAVMGDSFTYGNGVAERLRFSNLVGDAVASRGIEVLNFGFPGNNWPEHVRTLERRVLRLRPDYVLLQWGSNDIELDRDVAGRPRLPPLVADRDTHEWLHKISAFYTLLNGQWARYQLWRQMGDPYPAYLVRLYSDPASEGTVQAETLMRRFIQACRDRGAEVGIVLFPDAGVSFGADYPYHFMHEQVRRICGEEAITCHDLLPRLAAVEDHRALWVTPLDSHPSVRANQLAAEEILKVFAPMWGTPGGRETGSPSSAAASTPATP